jgi:hypothetical protein
MTPVRIVFISCVLVALLPINPYITFVGATVIQIILLKGKKNGKS